MANKSFSVRLDEKSLEQIKGYISDHAISNQQFMEQALECLIKLPVLEGQGTELELTDDDQAIVSEAIEASGLSYKELLYRALMSEAKKQITFAKTRNSLSADELKKTTVKGAAHLRIDNAINAIAHHNDHCENKADKIFISPSVVSKITGSNRKAINDYFEQNRDAVDKLNSKHELDESVNRKGKGYDFYATLAL